MKNTSYHRRLIVAIIFLFAGSALATGVNAQNDDPGALKARAQSLVDTLKYTEALPLYEKLSVQLPNDAEVFRNLGFCLLGQAINTADADARRQIRIRARDAFTKARTLGDKSLMVQGIIEGIPADGGDGEGYSDNAEANKLMQKAEASFTSGDMDGAFKSYQDALKLDPRCYYAALFSGDVKMQTSKFDEAETWYQRAIAIDPYKETAYRYSATPLMKQHKYDMARDRYIESYITAPYDKLAVSGIVQWAQTTNTPIGHPKIDVPKVTVGADGKKNVDITVNPLVQDGSMAWIAYSTTRDSWEKEKFAKTYPKEKQYRHSVAEEADALRSVVEMAKSLKPRNLNEQIALIQKMDADGVLEAYILLARPDQGIAADHFDYLRKNRDKLRLYVTKYVIQSKQ